MRLATAVFVWAVPALVLGTPIVRAADIGHPGALRIVREWLASKGNDPNAYAMRVGEDLCYSSNGRCYNVVVWSKRRKAKALRVKGEDGWMEFSVDGTTGQLDSIGIAD